MYYLLLYDIIGVQSVTVMSYYIITQPASYSNDNTVCCHVQTLLSEAINSLYI